MSSEDMRLVVENESCPSSTRLDVSLWNLLNHHLVEKILAKLPFKSLFRTSLLSKEWSHKLLNHSFQSEVLSSSSTWPSYSPLLANKKMEVIGYESGSQRWHKLAILAAQPYFPLYEEQGPRHSPELRAWIWRLNLIAVSESILCWMWTTDDACECNHMRHPSRNGTPYYPFYLCVSNPLTKSWKQLPPCPHMKVQGCGSHCPHMKFQGCGSNFIDVHVHVVCPRTNAYQVVLVKGMQEKRQMWDICVYIFDSGANIWTMDTYKLKSHEQFTKMFHESVYINGVIYLGMLLADTPNWFSLISFDLEKKMWSEQNLSIIQQEQNYFPGFHFLFSLTSVKLVVCGLDVMLVVYHIEVRDIREDWSAKTLGGDDLCVYRLDLEFGLAFAVSTAPKDISDPFMSEIGGRSFYCAAGVSDYIYLSDKFRSRPLMIMYNVTTQKWDWIPPPAPDKFGPFSTRAWHKPRWTLKAYQPGLNPFLEV